MLFQSKLVKRILCLAASLVLVLSFSTGVFAETIYVTETQSASVTDNFTIYTYNYTGLSESDVLSYVPSSNYYNSGGFSGYLSYSYYYVIDSTYVYGGICESHVGVVYSGTVTRVTPYENPKSQTYYGSTSLYSTCDQLDSYMCSYHGSSLNYNDAHYSGTLYYQGYYIINQYNVYSSIMYYEIGLIYTGTVYFHY